jgi:hypothetical protein
MGTTSSIRREHLGTRRVRLPGRKHAELSLPGTDGSPVSLGRDADFPVLIWTTSWNPIWVPCGQTGERLHSVC